MATPETSSSELLKVIYAVLGHRKTQWVVWTAAAIGVCLVSPLVIRSLKQTVNEIRTFSLRGDLWGDIAFNGMVLIFALVLVGLFFVILVLPIALIFRFGYDRTKSEKVNRRIEEALSYDGLPDDTRQGLQSLISPEKPETENKVKRWWRRITGVRLQWPE